MPEGSLIPRFGRARRDPALAVLEGFHPVKHALRFGARIELLLTPDARELARLARMLAPDVAQQMLALARPVSREVFEQLAPLAPNTPAMALARRALLLPTEALARAPDSPALLLEDPRDLGNLGACVRVAAAAGAACVLSTGTHDPWHPDALRGAAGLHFALAVCRLADLEPVTSSSRTLLAVDPEGEPLDPERLEAHVVLAFGSERYGVSEELTAKAAGRISIPMRPGVSSLNLATSVAAVLFAWRLSRRSARRGGE